jgi:hypothetical protein
MGLEGLGGVAAKEACTAHVANIIFQLQCLVAPFLSFWPVMSLFCIVHAVFSLFPQASEVGETHCLDPTVAHATHI